jgi:hypothetical protein
MKRGFNFFVLKSLLFMIPVVIGFVILYRLDLTPIITDSALFDHKVAAIQKQKVKGVKIMAIGSSITLYSINSEMLVQHYRMPYYNFSCWRLQMSDILAQLKVYVPEHHPEYVIICSSLGDFRFGADSSFLNYFNTSLFVRQWFPELFYGKNYSSVWEIMHRMHSNKHIAIDHWGGMELTIPLEERDWKAWNERWPFPTDKTPGQYRAMDSVAAFLRDQNIRLIFIQAPIKASYGSVPGTDRLLTAHFDTCRSIMERNGAVYRNYYDTTIFTDTLFNDQYHLLTEGGRIFTKKLFNDLDTIIK